MLINGGIAGNNRSFNIQRLNMSDEDRVQFQKLLKERRLSGNTGPTDFPDKIPTYTVSGNGTANFSPESLAMLNALQAVNSTNNIQPGTANARRAAAGLPLREIPEEYQQYVFRQSDFRIFAENALLPYMKNAEEHLAKMELAILHPNSRTDTKLSLAERTMLRESILQEAQRIAKTYLEGEDAQRFVDGFANLIREAEMEERGYIRVTDMANQNDVSFRRPFDQADYRARNDFVLANMTAEQSAQLDALIAEQQYQSNKVMDMARDADGNLPGTWREYLQEHHPEAWQTFSDAVFAARGFWGEMAEYHGFQEQWDTWQAGDAPEDNWFVQTEATFEANSADVAVQIEEIRLNFHNQLNLNGMDSFRSILEQLSFAHTDNPFWQWLMQLQVFNPA